MVSLNGFKMASKNVYGNLHNKVAIVTGASRGLGFSFALELARRGAKVAATYTSSGSETLVQELAEKIASLGNSSQCIGIKADLRDASSAEEIVRQTVAAFGSSIDILVNNAGAELVKPFTDVTPEDFDSIYHLNVRAPLLLTQAVRPHLRTPGRIINIGSVGGRRGFRNLSMYCSSKAALEGLTRCLATELGGEGHTVNTVNPGPVQSDMLDNIPREIIDIQKKQTALQNRLGTMDDVAQIVAWLASEESRWVSGQAISASGGLEMY
ncbi:Dehydrogenase OXI1 [Paramyrothecium foliicola]|nr:Dehydrogenase OXI1 [Paramyrothecium foliicola]